MNFALFAPYATAVELCLFERASDEHERVRVPLVQRTNNVWHLYLPDARPEQLYGYRVSGPWDPWTGHRFNAAKVVLDPYARAIGRDVGWHSTLFSYQLGTNGDGPEDTTDSAAFAPLAMVLDHRFDWGADRCPRTPLRDTVLYELHVKGFTALNERIPEEFRGTYLGVASAPAIEHLQALGVTAVELMPVHAHADEWRLVQAGLTNYWGYNTLSFFAPSARLAASRAPIDPVTEFKTMVRALHAAGIEVILDVVYNHTAEGDHLGPTLSMRGIDNTAYYRLQPSHRAFYENVTGCGNTVDARTPEVLQLIMDSLRYWVEEMHVDGFRFDLAVSLARTARDFDAWAPFFEMIGQDPVISSVKLIAEPWDVGEGGYQVGNFPAGWSEWNDRYRIDVRRFWRGDANHVPVLATRLSGSSDFFDRSSRGPLATVNFVTAHDGFTLSDLVAYNDKHNEANREDNRDGENNNFSWNCGAEGPTTDPAITDLRARQRRNLFMTLMVSLGIPMISGGDEMGRSQSGNNNAYCQDSALTWTPWARDNGDEAFLAFAQSVAAFRASQPVLRRETFLRGERAGQSDVTWLGADGAELSQADWNDGEARVLGMLLDGEAIGELDAHGQAIVGDSILLLFNSSDRQTDFRLPAHRGATSWEAVLDTAHPAGRADTAPANGLYPLVARSAAALRMPRTSDGTSG